METESLNRKNTALQKIIYHLDKVIYIYLFVTIGLILFLLRDGDDIAFHLQRMNAVMSEISNGGLQNLPIRIYHITLDGYGYGSPLFYSDIFFWPFAAFAVCLKLPVLTAYKIMLASNVVAVYFVSRKSFGWVTDDRYALNVILFLYIASDTVFGNITGSIVGRGFACVFVPLAICGFYKLIYPSKRGKCYFSWIPLSLGMAGLVLSNVIDAAIVCFVLIVLFIFCMRAITPRLLLNVLVAAIASLLITAWFWMPMIEQMINEEFFVTSSKITEDHNDLGAYTVPLIGLIFPRHMACLAYHVLGLVDNLPIAYYYCITFVIIVAIMAIIYRKEILINKFYVGACVLIVFFIMLQTKTFPFDLVKSIIGVIQFPYRIAIVLTALIGLVGYQFYCCNKIRQTFIIVLLSFVVLIVSILNSYGIALGYTILRGETFAKHEYDNWSIGAAEYLPVELLEEDNIGSWRKKLEFNDVKCEDSKVAITAERNWNSIVVRYSNNNGRKEIDIPYLYYTGYKAEDIDNNKTLKVYKNKNGLVRVIPKAKEGTIKVWYGGTVIQRISVWMSIISTVALIALNIISKRVARRKTYHMSARINDSRIDLA